MVFGIRLFSTLVAFAASVAAAESNNACFGALSLDELHATKTPLAQCSLEELSSSAATTYFANDPDTVSVRSLPARERSAAEAPVTAQLIDIQETSDGAMLRIDWSVVSEGGDAARSVQWIVVERTGWYWEAAENIRAGDIVSPRSVVRTFGEIDQLDRLTAEDWPAGLEARIDLVEGQTVLASSLVIPPDARAGDSAVYRVQRGPISIEMDADLMGATYVDDVAQVRLRHNGEIVYGLLQTGNVVVPCSDAVLPDRDACGER